MAHIIADRVKESSTTTGTGQLTLAGAVSGFLTFGARMANNDTCRYAAVDQATGEWEVGLGTYVSSGTKLTRTTVQRSSNSDAAVNWSAGTRHVFITLGADEIVNNDTLGTTQGMVPYFNGTTYVGLAPAATAGQMLKSGGSGANPSWGTWPLYDLSAGVPADSGFSWYDQNSATITETAGKAILLTAGAAPSTSRLVGRYKAVPSTPYTLTVLIEAFFSLPSSGSGGAYFVGWTDTTKAHILAVWSWNNATLIDVDKFSVSTNNSGTDYTNNVILPSTPFLQITDDGTNAIFRVGTDGVNFRQIFSVAKASGYLGSGGYTNLIWGLNSRNQQDTLNNKATLRLWDTSARAFP